MIRLPDAAARPLMNVRTLCLAMLAQTEMTGYEIRKEATEGRYSYFVDASYGSIYPALARLEEDGLVVFREEISPGKPARKVYSITGKGRAALIEALKEPPAPDIFRSAFLLIGMCRDHIDRDTMARAIDIRQKQLAEEIERLKRLKAEGDHAGTHWIIDYGLCCLGNSLSHLQTHADALIETGPDAAGRDSIAAE